MRSIGKFNILGFTVLFSILIVASAQINGQSVNIENPAFKNVKTAKIVVNQKYGEASKYYLPIQNEIIRLLTSINISNLHEGYDMVVHINIKGKALCGQYYGMSSSNERLYKTLYTGAHIEATVVFEINEKLKIAKTFDNKIDPIGAISYNSESYWSPIDRYSTPNDAPFSRVVMLPLYKAFYYCTYEAFGISHLIKALDTNINEKKIAAQEVLGLIKDPIAVGPLIQSVSSIEDNKSAKKAILAIRDPRAVEPLINALQNKDYSVREIAVIGLGPLKDSRSVEPLILALKDENLSVRQAAAIALGIIEDPRAVEPLINVINDLPKAVSTALGAIKDPRAVDPLINELKKGKNEYAARALGEIKDPLAVEPLIEALKVDDSYVVREAAIALGEIADPLAVEPLIEALKVDDPGVVKDAVIALGKIGDSRAVVPLIATIQSNFDYIREASKRALISINDPQAVQLLIPVLKENNGKIRVVVAETLGHFGDIRAQESLNAILNDKDPNISYAAAVALISIYMKDHNSVELLINALQSDNDFFRKEAQEALISITEKDYGYDYDRYQKWLKRNKKSKKI